MSQTSTAEFLDGLRAARLLDDDRLDQLRARPEAVWGDVLSLGRYAEQQGWLSPYQVSEVREGRAAGLSVGTYRVVDKLSDGPGGPTYKAQHPSLPEPVCVRLLNPDWFGPADTPTAFVSRTQAASLVQSPHLTNVLDAGTIDDTPFVVQEYVDGCPLFYLVNEMGALPTSLACEYARQGALALAAAHAKGVAHGAVSPLTLLLAPVKKAVGSSGDVTYRPKPGATVRLADLAVTPLRPPMGDTAVGETDRLGPVAYLPPEQFTRSDRSPAGDLYGLGAALYYLLTGRPPFAGPTAHEAMWNLRQAEPVPLESLRTDVPPAVAELIRKLLDRNPYARPAAGDVVEILSPHVEPAAMPGAVTPAVPSASETFTRSAAPVALPVAKRLDEPPPPEPAFADDIPEAPPEAAGGGRPAPGIESLHDDPGHGEHADHPDDVFGQGGLAARAGPPKPKVKVPYSTKQKAMIVLGLCLHLTATAMCLGAMGVIPNPFKSAPPERVKKDEEKKEEPKKKPAKPRV